MFFVGKKTIYLSLYENGKRVGNVGFVQLIGKKERVRLTLKIKGVGDTISNISSVCLARQEVETEIGKIILKNGTGIFEKDDILLDNISKIKVSVNERCDIIGEFPENDEIRQKDIVALSQEQTDYLVSEKNVCIDKWEQVQKTHSIVHPFGDDRIFVVLELKDFDILAGQYRKLMYNSFLLHGFYNYRHVILGKDCKLDECGQSRFYLGVPGVYYEREKQVAVMFGFEGFESAESVEVGKFGYYMREVKI